MGKGRRKRHNMRRKGQIGNSISAIVISFALVLSIMPANQVKAAQAAAKVITEDNVETSYETIGEAVSAMTDGVHYVWNRIVMKDLQFRREKNGS